MTTYSDLMQKSLEELARLAREADAQVRDLRFRIVTRQVAKVRDLRKTKRELARIKTALNSKIKATTK